MATSHLFHWIECLSDTSSACVSGQNLSDGQWHSIAVQVKGQKLSLSVDNQKPVTMETRGLSNSVQRTTVYFGGVALQMLIHLCDSSLAVAVQ